MLLLFRPRRASGAPVVFATTKFDQQSPDRGFDQASPDRGFDQQSPDRGFDYPSP